MERMKDSAMPTLQICRCTERIVCVAQYRFLFGALVPVLFVGKLVARSFVGKNIYYK